MTAINRTWDRVWWFILPYFLAAMFAPLGFWGFAVTSVTVDAFQRPPQVTVTRSIWRDVSMSYTVIVRKSDTLDIVCEGSAGPFPYRAQATGSKAFALHEWAGGDPRCKNLPTGDYVMSTTWEHATVLPFFAPRTKTVISEFSLMEPE